MKKLWIGAVLAFALGGAGAVKAASTATAETCCCDFSNGKIVCKITGQEMEKCCCKK